MAVPIFENCILQRLHLKANHVTTLHGGVSNQDPKRSHLQGSFKLGKQMQPCSAPFRRTYRCVTASHYPGFFARHWNGAQLRSYLFPPSLKGDGGNICWRNLEILDRPIWQNSQRHPQGLPWGSSKGLTRMQPLNWDTAKDWGQICLSDPQTSGSPNFSETLLHQIRHQPLSFQKLDVF